MQHHHNIDNINNNSPTCVDNDVEAAQRCQFELALIHTRKAHLCESVRV
jgi:hypothetical protein